jgi:hypothetical protein
VTTLAREVAAPRAWTLVILSPSGRVRSANEDHRAGRWSVTQERALWKKAAFYEAIRAKAPPLVEAHVALTIHLRNWRRADPQNYPSASSVKGLLDGLVAAGVLRDDRSLYLHLDMPILAPLEGRLPSVTAEITEVRP